MTPQAINTIGSFKPRGRFRSEWAAYEADAQAVAEAGAFAVVIEALAELLAARITKQIPIPTIGIGASAECDGQILVLEDMLGLSQRVPKFVKEYAHIGAGIEDAVKAFASEVRSRAFPSAEYTYPMCDEPETVTKKTKMTGS
jgi:3-methyl-2-oxobutanoate hydroxymethyltransferase